MVSSRAAAAQGRGLTRFSLRGICHRKAGRGVRQRSI